MMPLYAFAELTKALEQFNTSSSTDLLDTVAQAALEQMNSSQGISDCVSSWANAFTQEHASYSLVNDKNKETVFSEMYKSLTHTSALETLLQLENTYALAMDDAVTKMENAIKAMEEKYVSAILTALFLYSYSNNDICCRSRELDCLVTFCN